MEKPTFFLNLPKKELYKNLEIYKREGRRFFLRNKYIDFHIELYDKDLYEMVEKYQVGDIIDLSDEKKID